MSALRGVNAGGLREQDLLPSGGAARPVNSARAGYLPIALDHVPIHGLAGIGVYLRIAPGQAAQALGIGSNHAGFPLYCAECVRFEEKHRRRLLDFGVKFIYVRIADQARFKAQTENLIQEIAGDSSVTISERSTIVYETSVELMNELLAEPGLEARSPRLEQVSRAITTLVINDPTAFSHLYLASHHDFYTATHMVNVATWMVPLAYEMGWHDPGDLNLICQAGLLHDMGKTEVPAAVLNKAEKLTEEDWRTIRSHPEAGFRYLSRFPHVHPIVLRVTREHHERMDGTGYPSGLRGEAIHPVSRICAVVDSFDAMTAFRPFKSRTLSVSDAMAILEREAGSKYERASVEAWMRLMRRAEDAETAKAPATAVGGPRPRRRHRRQTFHCSGRLHVMSAEANRESAAISIVAHNISASGLGLLCQRVLEPGEYVRVFLQAHKWANRCLGGQVVRCRTNTDGWNEVGLEFTNLESDSYVESLPVASSRL